LIKYYNYIDWNDDNLIEKYIIKNNDVIYWYIMMNMINILDHFLINNIIWLVIGWNYKFISYQMKYLWSLEWWYDEMINFINVIKIMFSNNNFDLFY